MFVLEKLQNQNLLSANELIVANYLSSYERNLLDLSVSDIAKATYTSPSTTIRLAKKLGYDGWIALRSALYTEKNYLNQSHNDIDVNFPFSYQDSMQKIALRIEQLESDIIHETAKLIQHDELSKSVMFLSSCSRVYIFAMSNTASITHDFQYKMRFLFKPVTIITNRDDFSFIFQTIKKDDCCIFISYSGETFQDLDLTPLIINCPCPTISITGYHDNRLVSCTKAHLYIPDKEKRYAKIAPFASNQAIHYLLDVLYACVFSKNYEINLQKRKDYIQKTDKKEVL